MKVACLIAPQIIAQIIAQINAPKINPAPCETHHRPRLSELGKVPT
jgi:hypothetical protein